MLYQLCHERSRIIRVFPPAARRILIGDAGAAVLHVDDAAARKTALFDQVPHGAVVPVGVDADIAAKAKACLLYTSRCV